MAKSFKSFLIILGMTGLVVLVFDCILRLLLSFHMISPWPWPNETKVYPGSSVEVAKIEKFLKKDEWLYYNQENYELVTKLGPSVLYNGQVGPLENMAQTNFREAGVSKILKPNVEIAAERKTYDGLKIYQARYSIDEHSRRKVLQAYDPRKRNVILLGDSFTFGTGLNDDQIYAAYLAKIKNDFNVYNLGIYGAGANDVLDDLLESDQTLNRFSDIRPIGGYAIYTAIFDHVERSICSLKCYTPTYAGWVPQKTNYIWSDDSHTFERQESFLNSRPFLGTILQFLAMSSFIDYFHLNIPFTYTDAQLEKYVLMIAEMKKITAEKFKTKFIFTFYPNSYFEWDRIKNLLEKHDIEYLDYSRIDLSTLTHQRQNIVYDGHPSALSHALFAELIAENIK